MVGRETIANETIASSGIINTMQKSSIENSTQFNLTRSEIKNITDTDTNQTENITDTNQTGSISGTISSREGPNSSNCTVC